MTGSTPSRRRLGWPVLLGILAIDLALIAFGGALVRVIGALALIAALVVARAVTRSR